MSQDTRHRLNVLSKELNDILNALHESSKSIKKVTLRLILVNTVLYLFRKIRSVKGIISIFGLTFAGSIGYILDAFQPLLDLPFRSFFMLSSIGVVLGIAFVRILVLNEMSTVGSDMFHIEMYEKRRKKEYSSLISMSKERDYIFTLKEEIERELHGDTEKIRDQLEKCQEVLREKNAGIGVKNEAIYSLLAELDRSEEYAIFFKEKSDFLIAILYQLKAKLNLLVNDQFNLDNINFGSSYTLYRLTARGLVFIAGYGVNTAELDAYIPFKKRTDKYIQSIARPQSDPLIVGDFISWKRTLQDGSEWILSLHLDESNRDKLSICHDTGKLSLTITQEVLWICCELLNKFAKGKNI